MTQKLPDGFAYRTDAISRDEEDALVAVIESLHLERARFRGHEALREVIHLGYGYAYDSGDVSESQAIPPALRDLRDCAASLFELDADRFVECLVTHYPPGAGIGWHRDAPAFGSRVIGVSMRSPCVFRFRRTTKQGTERARVELEPRSAYMLSGAARWSWQHSIPAVEQTRFSATFRTLRDK